MLQAVEDHPAHDHHLGDHAYHRLPNVHSVRSNHDQDKLLTASTSASMPPGIPSIILFTLTLTEPFSLFLETLTLSASGFLTFSFFLDLLLPLLDRELGSLLSGQEFGLRLLSVTPSWRQAPRKPHLRGCLSFLFLLLKQRLYRQRNFGRHGGGGQLRCQRQFARIH